MQAEFSHRADKSVSDLLYMEEEEAACLKYEELMRRIGPGCVSPETEVAVGDCYARTGAHSLAVQAYERAVPRLEDPAERTRVTYLAGILLSRRLNCYVRARSFLEKAIDEETEPSRLREALAELERIQKYFNTRIAGGEESFYAYDSYGIIRQSRDPVSIPDVGNMVADLTDLPLLDVTRLIAASHGIFVRNVDADAADGLTFALQEAGIPVLAVPGEKWVVLPEAQSVEVAAFDEDGFRFLDRKHREERIPWEDVFCINAGRVSSRKRVKSKSRDRRRRGGFSAYGLSGGVPMKPDYRRPDTYKTEEFIVMDVLAENPFRMYRMVSNAFFGRLIPEGRPKNLSTLAADAERNAGGDVHLGGAVPCLGRRAGLGDYTFDNLQDFELNTEWEAQLAKHGLRD